MQPLYKYQYVRIYINIIIKNGSCEEGGLRAVGWCRAVVVPAVAACGRAGGVST